MSMMRQDVSCSRPDFRKLSADWKAVGRNPKDSISNLVVLRMDSSSSTSDMRFFLTSNCPRKAESMVSSKIWSGNGSPGHSDVNDKTVCLMQLARAQEKFRRFDPCRSKPERLDQQRCGPENGRVV